MYNLSDNQKPGERAFEIYSRLLNERIVFLGQEIDSEVANSIVAQLLFLEADNPQRDIFLYINSPGGSVSAGMGIYDAIQQLRPDVVTICLGLAAGMSAVILSAGAKGKRMAVQNSRIMLTRLTGGVRDEAIDVVQATEISYHTRRLFELLAQETGQPVERIYADTERDFFLSAEQAKDYGLIDGVIDRRS